MFSTRKGIGTLPIVLVLLTVLATGALADSTAPAVELRSGVVRPDRLIDASTHGPDVSKQRWVVRMKSAPGWSTAIWIGGRCTKRTSKPLRSRIARAVRGV